MYGFGDEIHGCIFKIFTILTSYFRVLVSGLYNGYGNQSKF